MATGDSSDILARLKSVIPNWFGDSPSILNALLQALVYTNSLIYSLYAYAKLQTRILTATDGWLDMIAADYFGTSLVRSTNQTDASFRARIIANLLRERATRAGISKVLIALTGRAPIIIEPLRPSDIGAYGVSTSGYGVAGLWGSRLLPFQAFVQAYRPASSGIPLVAGYGSTTGGYGVASRADYASLSQIQGAVTDADIYAAISSVAPAGTIIWANINN